MKKKTDKLHLQQLPVMPLSKWTLLKGALAALLVRLVFYFMISLVMIGLFDWAGLAAFSLKYVFVLMVGLFFFYLLFGKSMARY